jgi:putative transposase
MGSQVPAQVVENRLLLLTSIVVDIADLLRDRLVPRDRADTFELQIVKKRQRRLSGVDQIVFSLFAKGCTTEEISSHVADMYGASVSKETISRTTDQVVAEMQNGRPVHPAETLEANSIRVTRGQTNR